MQLNSARLCLEPDCNEVHDLQWCPKCGSTEWFPIESWIKPLCSSGRPTAIDVMPKQSIEELDHLYNEEDPCLKKKTWD